MDPVHLKYFGFSQNSRSRLLVKGPKSTKFDPTNHVAAYYLEIRLQKNFHYSQNPRWPPVVKKINFDKKLARKSHFGLANGSHSSDLDKFGRNILLDPSSKSLEEFLIHCKIQDGCHGRNLIQQITKSVLI